jgi:hypothetical protein
MSVLVLIFSAALVNACAASPPLVPIDPTGERWQFNGFSIIPPGEAGWSWVGREEQERAGLFNTTFVKKDGYRTCVARADLLDTGGKDLSAPEQLLSFVKNSGLMQEGPRQANVTPTCRIDDSLGALCVRYDPDAEDPNVPERPGEIFKIDGHGFICNHPMAQNVVAFVAF